MHMLRFNPKPGIKLTWVLLQIYIYEEQPKNESPYIGLYWQMDISFIKLS